MAEPHGLHARARKILERFNPNTWMALATLVAGAACFVLISCEVGEPMRLFGEALMKIKPTLFPKIAGISLIVTSIVALAQSPRQPQENPFRRIGRTVFRQIVVVLVALYLVALAFEPVGFIIAGVAVTALLSFYPGNRNRFCVALLAPGAPGPDPTIGANHDMEEATEC